MLARTYLQRQPVGTGLKGQKAMDEICIGELKGTERSSQSPTLRNVLYTDVYFEFQVEKSLFEFEKNSNYGRKL